MNSSPYKPPSLPKERLWTSSSWMFHYTMSPSSLKSHLLIPFLISYICKTSGIVIFYPPTMTKLTHLKPLSDLSVKKNHLHIIHKSHLHETPSLLSLHPLVWNILIWPNPPHHGAQNSPTRGLLWNHPSRTYQLFLGSKSPILGQLGQRILCKI